VLVEILTSRNFAQLRATLDAYKTVSMKDYFCAIHFVLLSLSANFHSHVQFLHLKYSIVSEVFKIIKKASFVEKLSHVRPSCYQFHPLHLSSS